MANLNEFFNKISYNNRIFSREDIGNMSNDEFSSHQKAIDFQLANLGGGGPTNEQLAQSNDTVYVKAYTRADGTHVKAHFRSKSPNITGVAANIDCNSTYLQRGIGINADYTNQTQMTTNEDILDFLGRGVSPFMPIAGANLQNARRDFEYAKKDENAHIINSRSEINNKGLNDLMNEVGIPKNPSGVFYDIGSKSSKKLFKSPEIQSFISNNFAKLVTNKHNPTADIEFTYNIIPTDNYLGLQHCKLYDPHFVGYCYS